MNMFSKLSAMAMAIIMVTGLTSCSGWDKVRANSPGDEESAEQDKHYVIATNLFFAPFEFQNDFGEYVGIDMDILSAIAKDQGFTYEIVPMTFNEMLDAVEDGAVDAALGGISITEERKSRFDFSEPYFDSGIVMAVAASKQDITNYSDLTGKTVAVALGTEAEAFAKSIQDMYGFNIVTFKNFSEVYNDILKGNSVAGFEDYPVMGYIISRGVELKIVSDIERRSSYGFIVPKDKNQELLEMFNKGLENLKATGEYQKILDTYIRK